MPKALETNITRLRMIAAATLLLFLMSTAVCRFPVVFIIMGALLSSSIFLLAAVQKKHFSEGHYEVLDGRCIDSSQPGALKNFREVLFVSEGRQYAVRISSGRKYRLLPGDRFYLYTSKDAVKIETDGVTEIMSFYALERHL